MNKTLLGGVYLVKEGFMLYFIPLGKRPGKHQGLKYRYVQDHGVKTHHKNAKQTEEWKKVQLKSLCSFSRAAVTRWQRTSGVYPFTVLAARSLESWHGSIDSFMGVRREYLFLVLL